MMWLNAGLASRLVKPAKSLMPERLNHEPLSRVAHRATRVLIPPTEQQISKAFLTILAPELRQKARTSRHFNTIAFEMRLLSAHQRVHSRIATIHYCDR